MNIFSDYKLILRKKLKKFEIVYIKLFFNI